MNKNSSEAGKELTTATTECLAAPNGDGQAGVCPTAEYWYKCSKVEESSRNRLVYMENAYNHAMNALIDARAALAAVVHDEEGKE